MKTSRTKWVSSKTALSRELGLSRQWITELFKLADHPPARSNGQHNVVAWRKFVVERAKTVQGEATEKEKLQIALLRNRVERERFEFVERKGEIERKIASDFSEAARAAIIRLQTVLLSIPDHCAPLCEGKSAREIWHVLRQGLQKSFDEHGALIHAKIGVKAKPKRKSVKQEEAQGNVVRFESHAAS